MKGQPSSRLLILTLGFLVLFFISNVVAPPPIVLEGVHWARDGPKFAYRVDGCNASYMAKYNLIWRLWAGHNVVMESSKPGCPSTQKEGPRH